MRFINMLSNSDSVQANTLGGIQIHQNKVHFVALVQLLILAVNSDSVQANTLGGIQIHQNKVHFKILKSWKKKTTELHLSPQIKFTKRENTLIKFSPTSCQNTTASPASIQIGSYQQSSSCTTSLPVAVPTQS